MNASVNSTNERPSFFGSFVKGAMSSALSGALMAGIVSLVSALPFLGGAAILTTLGTTAPLMILATALFGGVMAVKRVMFDSPASARNADTQFIPVPVAGMSGPAIAAPMVSADMGPEADQPTKNWTASSGRDADTQNRIQQIIAQGSMSDKDRASAILAAREAAASDNVTR